MQKLDKTTL